MTHSAFSPELSVVVPMFDEEDVLPLFVARLRPVLDGMGLPYEVICVDDGSRDATPALLEQARTTWPQLRVLRLRSNSGHQAALSAGLTASRGAWVTTIDADLQDPPEVIEDMVQSGKSRGVDVVYGVRTDRSTDTAFKRTTANAFYALMSRLGAQGAMNAGDFRLMSRATVDAVLELPEANRVLRVAVPALGFPSAEVGYVREERAAGESKYPLSKMLKLSFDAVTSLSAAPLRLATLFGVGGFLLAFGVALCAVTAKVTGHSITGWASTIVIISVVGALQLLCLGLLGEYVGRICQAVQARPTHYVAYDSLTATPAGVSTAAGTAASTPHTHEANGTTVHQPTRRVTAAEEASLLQAS